MMLPDDPDPGDGGVVSPLPTRVAEYWYTYDAENRVKVNNGALVNGQIVLVSGQSDSYEAQYDAAGRETARVLNVGGQAWVEQSVYDLRGNKVLAYYRNQVGEVSIGVDTRYVYDAAGQLQKTLNFYALGTVEWVYLDELGSVAVDVGGWLKSAEVYAYNTDGSLQSQTSKWHADSDWAPRRRSSSGPFPEE